MFWRVFLCFLTLVASSVMQFKYCELRCINAWRFVLQGVKPASYGKVSDPEIKEIIGECICHRWEER